MPEVFKVLQVIGYAVAAASILFVILFVFFCALVLPGSIRTSPEIRAHRRERALYMENILHDDTPERSEALQRVREAMYQRYTDGL